MTRAGGGECEAAMDDKGTSDDCDDTTVPLGGRTTSVDGADPERVSCTTANAADDGWVKEERTTTGDGGGAWVAEGRAVLQRRA